jgi:hypothetical protein
MSKGIERLSKAVPEVARIRGEFEAAQKDERSAEVALLERALAMLTPEARRAICSPLRFAGHAHHTRGLVVGKSPLRALVLLEEPHPQHFATWDGTSMMVPVSMYEVAEEHVVEDIVEKIADAVEEQLAGKLANLTEKMMERSARLRALATLAGEDR